MAAAVLSGRVTTYQDPPSTSDPKGNATSPGAGGVKTWGKEPFPSEPLQLGAIHVDPHHFIVRVGDVEMPMTVQEFRLLAYLIKIEGRAASLEELRATLWTGVAILPPTIDRHVEGLRTKLLMATTNPTIVRGPDQTSAVRLAADLGTS